MSLLRLFAAFSQQRVQVSARVAEVLVKRIKKTVINQREHRTGIRFQENRGQIADADGMVRRDIAFVAEAPGATLYFRPDGISYVFTKRADAADVTTDPNDMSSRAKREISMVKVEDVRSGVGGYCRMDMTLEGSNPFARIRAEGELPGYSNYYLPHCPDGITGVKDYSRIVYENVYDRVDHCGGCGRSCVGVLPNDFIMAVKTNPRFVEALMVGANHEMGREMLWQGLPTDQRGTPFQHFWQRLDGKNDIEFILMQRKPGGYRAPSVATRVLSVIPEDSHREWFQQIWTGLTGASTKHHPAPFPVELAERLIRMFSFVGDTVLDPFMGTATTNVAASKCGRNSIGVEVDSHYFEYARKRLNANRSQIARTVCSRMSHPQVASTCNASRGMSGARSNTRGKRETGTSEGGKVSNERYAGLRPLPGMGRT